MKKSIFLFFAAILCAIEMNAKVIYLDGNGKWESDNAAVFAHAWGGSGNVTDKMTRIQGTSIYYIEVNDNTEILFRRQSNTDTSIKWDDAWNKSKNLTIPTDKNYFRIDDWNEKGEWITWTIAGGDDTQILGAQWSTTETSNDMTIGKDGIFYLEKKNKQLSNHTLEFKVVKNHSWDESHGNGGSNQELEITSKYNYDVVFKFEQATKKVSATATKAERYITGNANLVGANEWEANAQKMTYDATANKGIYTYTFNNLAAEKIYDLKITDGSWDNHWGYSNLKTMPEHVSTFGDNNISFYLSQPGNVTVTFDAIAGEIELTGNFAKIVPTINLLGLNNKWEATAENKMNSKFEDVVSCTATLAAGTNQFKIYIKEFDKWYGNSAAIIRDNALVNKALSDGGSNISIQADVDGEYEFIWNYETKELSVVYPNTTVEYEKIYFVNSDGWSKVYAHLWLENSEPVINNVAWPGADITANKEGTVNGYDIHYVTFIKGAYDKCIFNGGGGDDKKTDNLAIMDDYKYFYQVTGSWYANLEDIEASTNKFILGEFNNWAKEHGEFLKKDENIYSITIPITAGTYEFKVVDDVWLGNSGTMERGGTSVTTGGWTFKSDDNSDCKLVADIDGDYTFTWYSDTKKLTVQYPTPTITLTTGDNSTVIAANIDKTVNVKIERSFTANDGYYTLCVPFNMDPSVIGKAYYLGDDIKKHVSGEGIDIELVEEKDMLLAGVPYLVLPKANMSELVVENVTIQSDPASGQNIIDENVQIFFEGFYSASGQTNGTTQYYVGNNGYLYNKVVDIRGLCGLFTINDENGAPLNVRARVVTREDAATGLDNNQLPITNIQKAVENGQLIIIRDGVKYNVQGVRL